MSLDLTAARAAIKAKVEAVVGSGNVHATILPDNYAPPRDALGRMSPYAVTNFGRPVPEFGRTINDGEGDYPHRWPVGIFLYAADGDAIQELGDELDAALIDSHPNGDDSTGLRGAAAYSYPLPSTDNIPARIELQRYYTCLVNMSRS